MRAMFPLSRPWPGGPVVLWGGEFPSGSLKYLTFSRYLESVPAGAKGLVELSGASSALALDTLGRERGMPVVALTDAAGTANLSARGFGGEVRTVTGLGEAWELAQGYEREGWCWPRQLANAALIGCVEQWATRLCDVVFDVFPAVRSVVCGFGTGATVVGLHRAFASAGYEVVGLQPARGHALPGWRRWVEQSLGERDLFFPYREDVPLETAQARGADCLGTLLAHARAERRPEEVLVISHDARPPMG
ncbi:pyridoxal-phosphate dependent enzyme [Pyxidicoccus xibeiensis]|uniref:pyridoxal-phosphate dependent enzyme n=1 Tax=Pyxidicoccus xibeiensis TaxID=2906759 RepID=UPI0020A79321|nr:pyridoxal-phosphate dependent enzyme [Pyxidicoccus xibeiensis]MCP3141054.1 PLP-dependent lyase/thiolase [Pyxidicoccus xibeiensis]